MEQKRKSSTLRSLPKEEDQTTEIARLRRVSFSEKKSVRIFSSQETANAWNNSFELSDRGEAPNNTNDIPTSSNDNQTSTNSALFTTNEFIDKTYCGDLYIENSLGITISEFEMNRKKKRPTHSEKKTHSNSKVKNAKDEILTGKSENTSMDAEENIVQLHQHNPEQPNRNIASTNFIYLNENSNKENIEPETIEVFDTKPPAKDKESETSEPSDGPPPHLRHIQQSTSQHHATTTCNPNQWSNKMGDVNISGITYIDSSMHSSPDGFLSPLFTPDVFPTASKKLSFQQLNEDIANGHLMLFPPTSNRNLLMEKNSEVGVVETAEPEIEMGALSRRIENNQTVYNHKDIEPSFVDILESARPPRTSMKDPTAPFEIGIESTCIDYTKISQTKNRRTAYFNECIETEEDQIDEKEFIASIRELKTKFDQTKRETSLMELTMKSDENFNDKEPKETDKNPKTRHRTMYFENEAIETYHDQRHKMDESVRREDVTLYAEENRSLHQPKAKLPFLHKIITEQHDEPNDATKMEITSKSKRYTQHFNESGNLDITQSSNEISEYFEAIIDNQQPDKNISACAVDHQSLLEENDCIVPETETVEEEKSRQNCVENISSKRTDEAENPLTTTTEAKVSYIDIEKTNKLEYDVYPSRNRLTNHHIDPIEGNKIVTAKDAFINSKSSLSSSYSDRKTKCNVPESEAMELIFDSNETKINEEIPIKRLTNYFDLDEPINIAKMKVTSTFRPETQAMDVSFESPKRRKYVDLTKNYTQIKYFNKNEETNVNSIHIEESFRTENKKEESKNFKKIPECRKTTYFGSEDSLNLTNQKYEMNAINCLSQVKEIEKSTNSPTKFFDQNEQIRTTKTIHQETECIIPETQAMDVSFESPKLRKNVDLPKHRQTNYFNQNEEIKITQSIKENEKLLNATKANPTPIEVSLISDHRREESKNSRKGSENRKTTYLSPEDFLDLTNQNDELNAINSINPVVEVKKIQNNITNYFDQNEPINTTKSTHKETECIIPKTQAMDVSFESPKLRKNVDLSKHRETNYFNQNEETQANAIQILEESLSRKNKKDEIKKLKKMSESRKTTYFEESLNITNTDKETNNPLIKSTDTTLMPEKYEKLSICTGNNDVNNKINHSETFESNVQPFVADNRYTHIYNNSDVINLTLNINENIDPLSYHQKVPDSFEKISKNRYTQHFNNTNAIISSAEELGPQQGQDNHANALYFDQHTCRKTLHFNSDNQMDITDQEPINDNKEEQFVHRPPSSIKSQDNENLLKKNLELSNKINMKSISKISVNDRQKTVLFASMVDEMEIDATPKSKVRTSCFNDYTTFTPGRSMLEFLQIEQEVGEHENENSFLDESANNNESVKADRNPKRSTSNLTPNLPISKKRQSMLCDSFLYKNPDGSLTENPKKTQELKNENSTLQTISLKENFPPCPVSYGQNKNIVELAKAVDSENILHLSKHDEKSSKTLNEPITPGGGRSETRNSRIPTYTGGAKKKNIADNSSLNSKSNPNIDLSLPTIELARFVRPEASHGQENCLKTFVMPDGNTTKELNFSKKYPPRKSIFDLEDQPITISDVSEHYLSVKQKRSTYITMSKTEGKNNKLMESLFEIIDGDDDIDKTKLELVETLLDETEVEENEENERTKNQNELKIPEHVIQSLESKQPNSDHEKYKNVSKSSLYHLTLPEMEKCNEGSSLLCRKCKCCKDMVLNETASSAEAESFTVPEMPSLKDLKDAFMKSMDKITRGPTLDVAFEFYERMNLQITADISDTSSDEDELDYEDPFIKQYKERSAQIEKDLQARFSKPMNVRKCFIDRLKSLLGQETSHSWILNAEMMLSQLIKFKHKQVLTNCILLNYEKRDPLGDEVKISSISLEDSAVPKRMWTAFDFMVHFQIQLELSFNIRSYCTGSSETEIFEMLIKLDKIFQNVVRMCKELWKLVCENGASLIRENGQTSIRKVIRKIIRSSTGVYQNTECQEICIAVKNIKSICFEDITMPPLYKFQEDIQKIPAGLDFLRNFLKSPASFFKSEDSQ